MESLCVSGKITRLQTWSTTTNFSLETCCPLYRFSFSSFVKNNFYFPLPFVDHLHHLFVFFLQASGQQIPVVVQSCVCFINLNGTHITPRTQWSCRYTFKELLSRIEIASVYQVFTMKGYFECQVLKWRSITFEMHLKEVDTFVCESRPATPMFTTGLCLSW